MYDAEKIKEVISDADSDNVRNKHYVNLVGIIINHIKHNINNVWVAERVYIIETTQPAHQMITLSLLIVPHIAVYVFSFLN